MERLTHKNYPTTDCDNVYRVLKNCESSPTAPNKFVLGGRAIAKLKEFEDFLEQQGVNSLEELKEQIIENNEKFIGVLNRSCRFEFEYRKIKNNWDMLKRFAEQFKEYDPVEANVVWKIAEKMMELEGDSNDKKENQN